ncbi:MAG: citrate transporter [Butyricicoccus pullicaecorum]|nr:citrate transporter [Butyricicoccus pullicaecorum]
MRYHSLRAFVHGEPVLSASLVCAVISMFFAPPSAAYLGYIDTRVLILLFCLMAVVSGMQKYGVFDLLAQKLLAGRHALRTIVLLLTLLPFFTSMAITNDVALITFVPFAILVLGLVGQRALLIPVIVLQTVAANLGSMVTPVGNPQNLFLYASYELSASQFFGVVLPFALVSLVGVAALALCRKSCILQVSFAEPKQITDSKRVTFFGVLFILCLLTVFHVLPDLALLGLVCLSLLLIDRDIFRRIDYGLLLTFVCFFLFAGNIGSLDSVRTSLQNIVSSSPLLASLAASQIISNVPAAVLLRSFTENWQALLLGVNIGGLGTPIASLASLISFRFYAHTPEAKPGRYLAWFTLINVVGLVILVALAWVLGYLG